ncbi:hypothetical protein PIB30_050103 [Stylosanthes scabra]|uniref:Uncharacterized protein n=1 Tax=Stylosanthes scabra TaxID=79078 RepID=A0ABU6ZGB8_9FABA|nr:hypothetical protein [Stylosanthes scabra]
MPKNYKDFFLPLLSTPTPVSASTSRVQPSFHSLTPLRRRQPLLPSLFFVAAVIPSSPSLCLPSLLPLLPTSFCPPPEPVHFATTFIVREFQHCSLCQTATTVHLSQPRRFSTSPRSPRRHLLPSLLSIVHSFFANNRGRSSFLQREDDTTDKY